MPAAQQTTFDANQYFLSTINDEVQSWLDNVCGDDLTSKTVYREPIASGPQGRTQGVPTKKPSANPPCLTPRTWRMWATGYGGGANYLGDRLVGSASTEVRNYGFGLGLDYQWSPNTLIGVSAGGGSSNFDVPGRSTSGSVSAFQGALYGAWRRNGLYATGIFSYGRFDNSELRTAAIPGVVLPASSFIGGPYVLPGYYETPGGDFASQLVTGYGEVGYQKTFGAFSLTPFAGLELGALHSNAFTEHNSALPSVIGLSYSACTIDTAPSFLGLQTETTIDLADNMALTGWARVAWKHEFEPDRSIEASFISAPGFDFTIQGAQASRNAAVANLGLKLNLATNAALLLTANGEFGSHNNAVGGTGGFIVSW